MSDVSDSQTNSERKQDQVKMGVLGATSYLLPLVSSIPPFWGGIMTLPFLLYLVGLIGNLQATIYPMDVFNLAAIFGSLILFIYCVTYLWRRKKRDGLVTTGPYRFVRHPQYFSVTIFTLILTFQSVWTLQHTFGIGWLSIEHTKLFWIGMLVAYAIIAKIEENYLENIFGSVWSDYKSRVGFILPLIKTKSPYVESILGVLFPYVILEIVLYLMA